MKFNELREANLSKAQINKVHAKADDLPRVISSNAMVKKATL